MTRDLLHKLLHSVHNCMWQSWYSEINFVLLFLIHDTGIPVPLVHIRVSPYLIIGFWLDSLGILAASCNIRIQITHPIIFVGNFRWWSKWHKRFLVNDFFRFHHNVFRGTVSWEFIVEDVCVSILFDRTSILSVEQAVCRPNIPCPGTLSTFAWKMQDVAWSDQALSRLDDSYAWSSRLVKEYRLKFCPPNINPELVMECKLIAHPGRDKCTRRNCSELVHCPAV